MTSIATLYLPSALKDFEIHKDFIVLDLPEYLRPTSSEGCMEIVSQRPFEHARALEDPAGRFDRSFLNSGGHVVSTRDLAERMWRTYIRRGRIYTLAPNRVGGVFTVGGAKV